MTAKETVKARRAWVVSCLMGGMSVDEAASATGLDARTVKRDLLAVPLDRLAVVREHWVTFGYPAAVIAERLATRESDVAADLAALRLTEASRNRRAYAARFPKPYTPEYDKLSEAERQQARNAHWAAENQPRKRARKTIPAMPHRRMPRAVELRAQGLSLRQIAERLMCSEGTVRNDLKRWQRDHPNAVPLRKAAAKNSPGDDGITHPGYAPTATGAAEGANVVPLRKAR
jgi:transposase